MTILLVDDYKPWRHYVFLRLKKEPELQIIYEACDGLEAVERSQKLQPDLILLDIGLPKMNGIEVVRQVRNFAPRSKILIVSQTSFPDVAQEALTLGASGYIDKADAAIELLPAVNTVLRGQKFVGRRLAGHNFAGTSDVGDPSVS